MVIEIRTKDNVMFNRIIGKNAQYQYDNLCNKKDYFKQTTKTNNQGTFLIFECTQSCKLLFIPNCFEIWLNVGDYFKII